MRDPVQPKTVLPGGYVVEAQIAEGRVCNVFRARGPDDAPVAARVLRRELVGEFSEWFAHEAQARAALDHPVIPRTFAVGYHEGLPVEIMALTLGRSGQELLDERQGGLDVPTVMRILRSIASGLDHLHERTPPLLHRALSPEHVLVRDDDGAVVLLGVGEANRPRLSISRPAYSSPEELAGITSLSPRADVFSLATLAFELFTGRPAFVGGGDVVLDTVRMGRLPKLRERRGDLSARTEVLLREAWSLSPEDRPPSAGRFAALLAEAANQQSQTLVDAPADGADADSDARARDATLVGPGPVNVAARRAREAGGSAPTNLKPIAPQVDSSSTRARGLGPAREDPNAPRAVRAARGAPVRPRSFLPKPTEGGEDATRPEIHVPSEVRVPEPVRRIEPTPQPTPEPAPSPPPDLPEEPTPVTHTHVANDTPHAPKPRFSRTTPGMAAPVIVSAVAPAAVDAPATIAVSPSLMPPAAATVEKPSAQNVEKPTAQNVEKPTAQTVEKPTAQNVEKPTVPTVEKPTVPTVEKPTAQNVEKAAITVSPTPAPATFGPLSGTHFSPDTAAPAPAPQASQRDPFTALAPPQGTFDEPPEAPDDDEATSVIAIPSGDAPAPWRNPWVIASFFIAQAVIIVGIAHAIAWTHRAAPPPTIVRAPEPVCAPCAACPACAACPEPPPAPAATPRPEPATRPPIVRSPAFRPPAIRGPRPTPIREVPTF